MKFSKIGKNLAASALIVGSMWAGSAYAQMADYQMLEAQIMTDLATVGVSTAGVDQLTMAEMIELSSVLESNEPDADKAMAAKKLIGDAMAMPARVTANEGRMQLQQQLMVKLTSLGLTLPPDMVMSPSQVARLSAVFDGDNTDEQRKQRAETILAETMPAVTKFGKSGYTQLEAGLVGKFAELGLDKPAFGSLTLSQVAELHVIFDSTDSDDTKKQRAMKVISGT